MLDFEAIGDFLKPQVRDLGGNVEIDTDAWGLFGVRTGDTQANLLARALLSEADFPWETGPSEDEQWTLYYVSADHREGAVAWLNGWMRKLAGEIPEPTRAQQKLLSDLPSTPVPHRIAQQLAAAHARNEASAGIIRDPQLVRSLLDRLHTREPLYWSAFRILLTAHLVDMSSCFTS